ncbi:MAG: ATP-dependent Clp protease ATP-binding subunit [Alistipes sp.]|nr:ATP-dependent Clp protease ATP-binding subunit [Alistipes sp.]
MDIKISRALESIIAQVIFDTSKQGIDHSLKDVLMLALLRSDDSMAHRLLANHLKDWELYQIALRLEREIGQGRSEALRPEQFFADYVEALRQRFSDARRISTSHVAVDIIGDPDTASSRIFAMYRLTAQMLEQDLESVVRDMQDRSSLHIPLVVSPTEELQRTGVAEGSLVARFGTDLTRLAEERSLDPVVGREREIERVVQILSRRKKNNPVLVGEAGVGKSAIVEGLALRIVSGDVPQSLAGKSIVALDVSSLVAGTKFRGEFEERMQQLLDELRRMQNTIIFIDEIHTIVGAGATQGSLDTANILKPALARGQVRTIGATTLDEYRENIEHDAALERRFQRVMVEPATSEQTLEILRNIRPVYEAHHGVKYTEESLCSCIDLSVRYITDRHLPDKAIDLLDETGARLQLALAEGSRAERAVTAEDVAHTVTSVTGVPAERVAGSESERLQHLEEYLASKVVGQAAAVRAVARSVRRSRAGLKDAHRPVGVFMFVGPTGVGKTLLAKELAGWLTPDRDALIRLDMSEYGERHNVARLIGSPPGYVGYGEGGGLSEAVRRHPYSVVLLDEIEKAHPDIFNVMLQIFDEGWLTDGAGRKVDFRNTIIVMTSNVGQREVASGRGQVGYSTQSNPTPSQSADAEYRKALERCFSPEFLNRVDEILFFRHLSGEDVQHIVDLELDAVVRRIEALGYALRVTDSARRELSQRAFEPKYGARALKREIAARVEFPVSEMILDGVVAPGDMVTVTVENGEWRVAS